MYEFIERCYVRRFSDFTISLRGGKRCHGNIFGYLNSYSFNPSVAILAATSAKTDKIFEEVNTNNFSSNIFPSAL
jgi:hypothetical protein